MAGRGLRVPGRVLVTEEKRAGAGLRWTASQLTQRRGVREAEGRRPTERAVSQRAVRSLEGFAEDALFAMWGEQEQLVEARLRGRKARHGTRHWVPGHGGRPVVTKAIDPDYVLRASDVADAAREYGEGIALHVATEAFAEARSTLGADLEVGVDSPLVQQAVADAVARITGLSEERAAEVRDVILRADSDDVELDEILDRVRGTYAQRRAWAEAAARSTTNGLVNRGGMAAAAAAGVATKEWLSSHDDRVRATHRVADGQVQELGEPFTVGGWQLDYPSDAKDWPASAPEVAGCRCSLLFGRPNPLVPALPWQDGDADVPDAAELAGLFSQLGDGGAGSATGGPLSALASEPLIAFRVASRSAFDAEVGQELETFGLTRLTLLRAQAEQAQRPGDWLIVVEIPAASGLRHEPGAVEVALYEGAVLQVVAVSDDTVRLRLRP